MLRAYTYSPIEEWLEMFYRDNGFLAPEDLDIDEIAKTLDIHIEYTSGPDRAIWDDENGIAIIFLQKKHPIHLRREIFFHELCHTLRHSGDQDKMNNSSFMVLQEVQASQFQLYSAIPFFMINAHQELLVRDTAINEIATRFNVSYELAKKRLSQIKRRILQREIDLVIEEQPVYNATKEITTKPIPNHARSLVEKAILSKQIKKGDGQ